MDLNITRKKFLELLAQSRSVLKPPSKQPLSKWAEEHFKLSNDSAMQGAISFDVAPFQREVLDTMNDPATRHVTIAAASQTLKTQAILLFIAWSVAEDPSPTLIVQSTGALQQTFSKSRLSPMLKSNLFLKNKFNNSRQRDSGNTISHKEYSGGFLKIASSGSVTDLSSFAIRFLLMDEVSRMGDTAEGCPVEIAGKRTSTYLDSKTILVSSPATLPDCKISNYFEKTDQRHWYVTCTECDKSFEMMWKNIKWETPESEALLHCPNCTKTYDNVQKNLLSLQTGHWLKHAPENIPAGFQISAIPSNFVTLNNLKQEFLDCESNSDKLKVFINTRLGEPWKDVVAEKVERIVWHQRTEQIDLKTLPTAIKILCCGVDTQRDRLEASLWGFSENGNRYFLDHKIFYADMQVGTEAKTAFASLKQFITMKYKTVDNRELSVSQTCIDSGGHSTQFVYSFANQNNNVIAIKGSSDQTAPLWMNRKITNTTKILKNGKGFMIGSSMGKKDFYNALSLAPDDNGYIHINDKFDDVFLQQLTSKTYTIKYKNGVEYWAFELKRNSDAEGLDCAVYAFAALQFLKIQAKFDVFETVAKAKPRPARATSSFSRGLY